MTEPHFLSAVDVASAIRGGRLRARELLEHMFARVDRFNGELNAVVVQDRDGARARADAADAAIARGDAVGPLHGVPMTIKESYDRKGMPSTWGIPEMRNNVALRDALAVQRLERAGAVVYGKTNVPLRLADFQSYNDIYGATNNPWNKARTPGGSSGGSAVSLAAGFCSLEIGSDIGGSIRNPAHYCGVFGHKPTWNLLPMRGHALAGALSPTDISVIGPLARSAADLEIALRLLAEPDVIEAEGFSVKLTPLHKPLSSLRIAVWANDEIAPVSKEVIDRVMLVANTLAKAGANIDADARPAFTAAHSHATYQALLQSAMSARTPDAEYRQLVQRADGLSENDLGPAAQTVRAQTLRHRDWATHNEARTQLRYAWHEFFEQYDFLLTPIMPTAAFPHDHGQFGQRTIDVDGTSRPYFEQLFWAGLTGVSLLPSTIVPTGSNGEGLPIGVQIIGPAYGDLKTIQLAQRLESLGFAFAPPPDYR